MVLRLLAYVAVVIVGGMMDAAIRDLLGTKGQHRSRGRGIVYGVFSTAITILRWEALVWALSGGIWQGAGLVVYLVS